MPSTTLVSKAETILQTITGLSVIDPADAAGTMKMPMCWVEAEGWDRVSNADFKPKCLVEVYVVHADEAGAASTVELLASRLIDAFRASSEMRTLSVQVAEVIGPYDPTKTAMGLQIELVAA